MAKRTNCSHATTASRLWCRKRFDARNVIRVARRFLSPHPAPLPSGRGNSEHRAVESRRVWIVSGRRRLHPLLKGEGRGEGKRREVPSRVTDQSRNCRTRRVLRQPEVSQNDYETQQLDLPPVTSPDGQPVLSQRGKAGRHPERIQPVVR